MNQAKKDGSALRMTVFGLLAHYAYAILLFLHSPLTERLSLPLVTLYLGTAGVPIVLLSALALQKDRRV